MRQREKFHLYKDCLKKHCDCFLGNLSYCWTRKHFGFFYYRTLTPWWWKSEVSTPHSTDQIHLAIHFSKISKFYWNERHTHSFANYCWLLSCNNSKVESLLFPFWSFTKTSFLTCDLQESLQQWLSVEILSAFLV